MRDKIFTNKPMDACYGCQACAQICSHGAITMQPDDEGFLFPQIDVSQCVDCGLCHHTCPTQEENFSTLFHPAPQTVYAAWNRNLAERLESTSGGLFYLLAQKILNEGGAVYGADYKNDLTVYHRRFVDSDTLKRARGSKYMQSNMSDVYIQVKKDLKDGRKVLFSGTPCQVAGLRLFLKKPYENLITIDLVCHGVPSPLLFKEHIRYLESKYKDKIIDFKFRAKKKSGWRSYVKYVFFRHRPLCLFGGKDFYSHSFHLGYFNRASCYTCDFSQKERVGDITLSDFWNAETIHHELRKARKWGFNLVMCNTIHGQELFNSIIQEVECHTYPVQTAIDGDVRLRHTEQRPALRDQAYKLLNEKGCAYLEDTYGGKLTLLQRIVPTWIKNVIREIQCRI